MKMKYTLKTILSFEVGAGIKPLTFHAGFQTSMEISDAFVDMETFNYTLRMQMSM